MRKNKIIAFILVAMMAFSVGSAFAVQITFTQSQIPAANVTTVPITGGQYGLKSLKPGYLYVRHYLWSSTPGYYGTSNYTNFFQAIPFLNGSGGSVRYGGNWMAPDTANYVRSPNIVTEELYAVAARANTKYADDGFSTIQISGYMDSNH